MNKSAELTLGSNLEGQFLIAMPGMADGRFARSVIYLCAHSDEGAMGLIINQPVDDLSFGELLEQIDIFEDEEAPVEINPPDAARPIYTGGPVEQSRGFVLHSPDYISESSTIQITEGICLTATTDILRAIATGNGPAHCMLALGYAGWAPGQLESELAANGWLNCAADPEIVFGEEAQLKYEQALSKLGVNPSHLVNSAGRA